MSRQGFEKLRIGDVILLKNVKPHEGWLSAEGIIDFDIFLCHDDRSKLENCLWQITVQNQYTASFEYEQFLLGGEVDEMVQSIDAPGPISTQHYFQRTAANEKRLNKKLMSMKTGKPIAFGDVIQLLHLKSKKFLTVSVSSLARQERENLRIHLDDHGDNLSWLQFMPRFKHDREGHPIHNLSECFLRVHERPSEFIHVARRASKIHQEGGDSEINCSLETSTWTIVIYQPAKEIKSRSILMGNVVTLYEPETSTYLTLAEQRPGLTISTKVIMSNTTQLSLTTSDCQVGTNYLWKIEAEDRFVGGVVYNRGGKVALRDFNTGLYLRLQNNGQLYATPDRDENSLFDVCLNTQTESTASVVEGAMINLQSVGKWVSLSKEAAGSGDFSCVGNRSRASALCLQVSTKLHNQLGYELYVCVEATKVLQNFLTLVVSKEIVKLPPAVSDALVKTIFSSLTYLLGFLQAEGLDELDISDWSKTVLPLESDNSSAKSSGYSVRRYRQVMAREQGLLNILLQIIEYVDSNSEEDDDDDVACILRKSSNLSDPPQGRGRSNSKGGRSSRVQVSPDSSNESDITRLCMNVLYLCLEKNHDNQMHVADRFTVILNKVIRTTVIRLCLMIDHYR
jgi:hypothetical protein